jgi:predicted hydrocarbon binding protein
MVRVLDSISKIVNYDSKNYKLRGELIPSDLLVVLIYAYMQKVKDLGSDTTLYEIGYEIGKLISPKNYDEVIKFFENNNIGKISIEEKDNDKIEIKVKDCVFCKTLESDEPICDFEAGLIAGFLESIKNRRYFVKEIYCQAQGYNACVFIAESSTTN